MPQVHATRTSPLVRFLLLWTKVSDTYCHLRIKERAHRAENRNGLIHLQDRSHILISTHRLGAGSQANQRKTRSYSKSSSTPKKPAYKKSIFPPVQFPNMPTTPASSTAPTQSSIQATTSPCSLSSNTHFLVVAYTSCPQIPPSTPLSIQTICPTPSMSSSCRKLCCTYSKSLARHLYRRILRKAVMSSSPASMSSTRIMWRRLCGIASAVSIIPWVLALWDRGRRVGWWVRGW